MDERIRAWENRMPADLQANIDFVSNMIIVLVAFVLRKMGVVRAEHIPGMHVLTFTFALPALVLGVMWTVELDAKLLSVFLCSTLTNAIWTLCATLASRCAVAEHRGFFNMGLCGGAMAFVYPVILQSDRFGPEAAAVVVAWELGGNLFVVVLIFGLVSSAYASNPPDDTSGLGESPSQEIRSTIRARGINLPVVVGMPSDEEGPGAEVEENVGAKRALDMSAHLRASAGRVARIPVIWTTAAGLLLNVLQVPVFPLPAKAVQVLGAALPPLLYAFIGTNLRLNLGRSAYGTVARLMLARLFFCAAAALLVRFVLPLSPDARSVCILCVTAPIAMTFCMYTSMYGYPMDLSVMIYNTSALTSIVVMGLLVNVV